MLLFFLELKQEIIEGCKLQSEKFERYFAPENFLDTNRGFFVEEGEDNED